ncbi:4-hydroxy-3-methylbut-2-enyl diphosphate reductase [Fulvivirga imtechensis AK7]|uniref:4-hydroxy-3-methylbut-2-enyl diphosphate reductase n=1 Tax=Fulvivirga imtechensis AK7 TaxID=1237149 RepID=L8JX96_9BACT|nr:4-hydroxy-3-methylbut-2-enyl diphosphate reductase [Fulvivirga imtechensis]ELR72803.1 4-hydroxy-3-methylbut-2-enyl diphosphate reductase [Fulvivirga imtechensis AK7]
MHRNKTLSAIKKFDIPEYYRSSITGKIKEARRVADPRKKDFAPTELDFGPVKFYIARHFGFCYGVENAIEISYKALEENPDKRVFLLSQMIHNQEVNKDLQSRGIEFIMDTDGTQFIPWNELKPEDIVIIPAFGTTLEIEEILKETGIEVQRYNTTCPFVEKVWKRSEKLGKEHHTIIIHGKHNHEETRATFSHSSQTAPSVIVKDMAEAKMLGEAIKGNISKAEFFKLFEGKYSQGFDPDKHFDKLGVVNQTTMLATETQEIADYIKQVIIEMHGENSYKHHFADTRDTLCYATNDNQDATYGLLEEDADLAIVVGGYNSSNTSHIVELCERKFPTFFINSEREIISNDEIHHYDYHNKKKVETIGWLPAKPEVKIILTSGASCPDTLVDQVMLKIVSFFPGARGLEGVMDALQIR